MLLERYPANVKVLRAYAKFYEDVKHDPWGAARYHRLVGRVAPLLDCLM